MGVRFTARNLGAFTPGSAWNLDTEESDLSWTGDGF